MSEYHRDKERKERTAFSPSGKTLGKSEQIDNTSFCCETGNIKGFADRCEGNSDKKCRSCMNLQWVKDEISFKWTEEQSHEIAGLIKNNTKRLIEKCAKKKLLDTCGYDEEGADNKIREDNC